MDTIYKIVLICQNPLEIFFRKRLKFDMQNPAISSFVEEADSKKQRRIALRKYSFHQTQII